MKTTWKGYLPLGRYIKDKTTDKSKPMKATLFIACLWCMLSFNTQAQGDFSAHVHIASPSTIFGGGDADGFYGVIDYDDPFGYAGLGLGIGLEYHHPFGDKGISGLATVDLFRNGIKRSHRVQYKQELDDDAEYFSFDYKIKFSAYYNIPILLGVHYDFTISEIPFFIQGGPLLDILKVSNARETYTYPNIDTEVDLEKYAPSVALGYGVKAGITLSEKYILGIGYKSLGTHSFLNTSYNNVGWENESSSSNTEVKKIGLINFSFGIKL